MNQQRQSTENANFPAVQAQFTIRGNGLDLGAITAELGLAPSSARSAGSRSRNPLLPRVDIWAFQGRQQRTVDASGLVDHLVGTIVPVADNLARVRRRYPSAVYDITLVVYVASPGCEFPDINLAPDLMATMSRLGLRFNVSTYAIADDHPAN